MSGATVGAMTICKDEESVIPFCIASLLPVVDLHVVVDTGSVDKTLDLIKHFFSDEIRSGKLLVFRRIPVEKWNMSEARNLALTEFRKAGIDYWIKADADEVFYTNELAKVVARARDGTPLRELHTYKYELYQYKAVEDETWLQAIIDDVSGQSQGVFLDRDMTKHGTAGRPPAGHPTIRPVAGAVAVGKWTDEAATKGRIAEGVMYPQGCPGEYVEWGDNRVMAHYGWARPVEIKRTKEAVWKAATDNRPTNHRVETLQDTEDGQYLLPWNNHPQAVHDIASELKEVLYG